MNESFNAQSNTVSTSRIIYTPSSFARTHLLHLQETGKLRALHPHVSKREKLLSYLIFIVRSGEGRLEYQGKEYQLKRGDMVFLDCSVSYLHETSEKLWNLQWCHFQGPEMVGVYEKYKSRGGKVVFQSSHQKEYEELLNKLNETAGSDSYVRDMEINTLLSSLLVLLMKDAWNPEEHKGKGKRESLSEIREYIRENYAKELTLEELSARFYINKTYLSELFKEQYGISIKDFMVSVRITEAKKLLRFTRKTTEEIAAEVGVNGAAYFSRMFKRVEGVSPKEYRAMW